VSASEDVATARRFDGRAVAVCAALAVALVAVAFAVKGPARPNLAVALGYALAFRVVLLAYTGRKRNVVVVLLVPLLGGAIIAQWWAVLLCLVNGVLIVVFGPRRDVPKDPLTPSEVVLAVLVEGALLAVGVSLGRWPGE